MKPRFSPKSNSDLRNSIAHLKARKQVSQKFNKSTKEFKFNSVKNSAMQSNYRDYYNDNTKQIVQTKFEKDINTFGYKF